MSRTPSENTDSERLATSAGEARGAIADPLPPLAEAAPGGAAAKAASWGVVQRARETLARVQELEQEAANSRLSQGVKAISAKAGTSAMAAGRYGAQHAASISRERVLPSLAALARRVAASLHPRQVGEDARNIVLWCHKLLFDRRIEALMFRPTATPAKLSTLSVQGSGRKRGHDYRPTPRLVFDWAMSALKDDPAKLSFIDYGAGRGRVLLMAAERPFRFVGGIEFARELHDDAAMNIAQFPRPRMRCRDVDCLLGNATELPVFEEPAVHYFFDPFSRTGFAEVLKRLTASYRETPRLLYVVLVDSADEALVERSGIFRRVHPPMRQRLSSFLFSPYRIAVFRSLEG